MKLVRLKENLEKKGYNVRIFDTKEEARAYLTLAYRGHDIGFGGSETLNELGLYEALSEHNRVVWHWKCKEGEDPADVRRAAAECAIYFSSVNAISLAGEIVNIDGTANRVAALLYGRERVCYVLGENKVCDTLEEAVWRARNVAAPKNTYRLGVATPCAAKGDRCYDCKSPARICRALSVLWEKPSGSSAEVILIRETLGF